MKLLRRILRISGKKALIVTGKIITKTGLAAKVQDVISVRGISSVIFNDLPGEPDDKMIDAALSVFKVAIHFLMNSTLGKGISAVKYDEISAEIMSVDTNRMKLIAFTFSSFLAGIAGGLFAHLLGFINPSSFGIMKSTESLVMVYLGGMGSLSGSVISAVVFTFLLELLRPAQILKWVIIPLILILIMEFHPEGIMGSRELTQVFPTLKKLFPANKNLEKPEALSKEGGAA